MKNLWSFWSVEHYTLIIDEVMEVMSQIQDLRKDDIPMLIRSGFVEIVYMFMGSGRVHFVHPKIK